MSRNLFRRCLWLIILACFVPQTGSAQERLLDERFEPIRPENVDRLTELHRIQLFSPAYAIAFAPQGGALLALAQDSGIVSIWDAAEGQKLDVIR